MRIILQEQRRSSMAAAAVVIILGLLLLFWPDLSVSLMCMILGGAIVVTGVIYIGGWISRRKLGAPVLYLLPGVILCALGVWLITRPDSVVRLIQYIFGAIILFHGIVDLQGSITLIRYKVERCWLDLIPALLTLLLGGLILLNPFGTFAALVMLIGCSLIFDGVSDLYLIWRLGVALKDMDVNGEW